jgi:signal transduction histidine kinase
VAVILPTPFAGTEAVSEIWVADQGPGIPAPLLTHIFQRFVRIDTSLTRTVNGLGLGLALTQHIVQLHRGMLWVESTLGAGSTFHVVLPRAALQPLE